MVILGYVHWHYARRNSSSDFKLVTPGGDQVFRFTNQTGYVEVYGQDVTGDDVYFIANSVDGRAKIGLLGNGGIRAYFATGNDIRFYDNSTELFRFAKNTVGGCIHFKEGNIPTAITSYGAIYTKGDNKLYFQDGAGTEHEVAFV